MKSFLKRIDQYLLKNYPLVWTTRIHYFIPWWILGAGIIFLGIMAQNPVTYDGTESLVGWLVLLAICGLVLWIIYYFRFNKWKSYGNYKTGESLAFWGLNLIIVGLLAVVPQLKDLGRMARANMDYSDAEIVQDINNFNFAHAYASGPAENLVNTTVTSLQQDSGQFYNMLRYHRPADDSMVRSGDTIFYYSYNAFYRLSLPDEVDNCLRKKGLKVWTGKEIYYLLKARGMAGVPELERDGFPKGAQGLVLSALNKKYGYRSHNYADVEYGTQRTIDEVADAKFHSLYYEEDFWRVLLYSIFSICLLLYIFKNTTLKTFGVSAGVAVLLPFLVVLIMLMVHPRNDSDGFIIPLLFYIVFACLALAIFGAKKRNIFQGIALNYFTLCTPFLGAYFAAWYATYLREGWNTRAYEVAYNSTPYPDFDRYILAGELIGIVVFFILLEPLFQRLYLKWYALPEE